MRRKMRSTMNRNQGRNMSPKSPKVVAQIGNFDIVYGDERIEATGGLALVGRFIDRSQLAR